jgi:TM2 domain-containing membrane protein YozV
MAPVLLAGAATFLFAVALLLFGIGGADRFVIGAVLAGLLALSFAVLARFAGPRR